MKSRLNRLLPVLRMTPLIVLLAAAGCGGLQTAREEDHPLMRRAMLLERSGSTDEAIAAYQRVLETRPTFARAHLNLAGLYNQPPKEDFLRAIYHYQRYLELRPKAENAQNIRELIQRAQINFAATLPSAASNEMLDLVADLRKENASLRARIAELQGNPLPAPAPTPTPAPTAARTATRTATPSTPPATARPPATAATPPAPPAGSTLALPPPAPAPGPRTHVVQAGETLSSIANKAYNDPSAWRKIYDANRDKLSSPAALRQGQTLVIP